MADLININEGIEQLHSQSNNNSPRNISRNEIVKSLKATKSGDQNQILDNSSPSKLDRKASYDQVSENQMHLDYSQKSSQQQLKFISTKNLRQASKKFIEKRGSARNNNMPALLRNQTSLNEDLMILETNNEVKQSNQSPSKFPPKVIPRTSKNKHKSGKQSKKEFEFQGESPSKSANGGFQEGLQSSPSQKTKKEHQDSNIYIKDSEFRLNEQGSIGTINESADKLKKILQVETGGKDFREANKQGDYDQSSPETRSPCGSSAPNLERSEMVINTLNQTLNAPITSNVKKFHIKHSQESGSDGFNSSPDEKFHQQQDQNSPQENSILGSQTQFSPSRPLPQIPLPAQVRITSKQMQRNDVKNPGIRFLPAGGQSQQSYFLEGSQYFNTQDLGSSGFIFQAQRGGSPYANMMIYDPIQMQEYSTGVNFPQQSMSIAQYETQKEYRKVKRSYDISKNIGIAKKNAQVNHKAHQLLAEAARSQQKWMYDFADENPMIISSMPMDIPKVQQKSRVAEIKKNNDGQTQISLSKFNIDMPGSALKKKQKSYIPDANTDDQASMFDPEDPRKETFQKRQNTQGSDDDNSSPNSPPVHSQFGMEETKNVQDLSLTLRMNTGQDNMDITLKNPKLLKVENSEVDTIEDLHKFVSPPNELKIASEQLSPAKQSGVETGSGSRNNRVPVTSNLSMNSRISQKKPPTATAQNDIIEELVASPGVQKVKTVTASKENLFKNNEIMAQNGGDGMEIISGDRNGMETIPEQDFVLNDSNFQTQKLQFDNSFQQNLGSNLQEFSVLGGQTRQNMKPNEDAIQIKPREFKVSSNYNADVTFAATPIHQDLRQTKLISPVDNRQRSLKKGKDSRMISGTIQLQGQQIPFQESRNEINNQDADKKSILGEIISFMDPTQSIGDKSRTNQRRSPNVTGSPNITRQSIMSKISKYEQGTGLDSMMINASKMKFYVSSKAHNQGEESSQYHNVLSEIQRSRFGQLNSPNDAKQQQPLIHHDKGFGVRMGTLKSLDEDQQSMSSTQTYQKPRPAIGSVNAEINPRLGTKAINRQVLLKKKAELNRQHKNKAGVINSIGDILYQNKKVKKREELDKTLKQVYLNSSHGFWQQKKTGFEDDSSQQKSKDNFNENNSLLLEDQIQKSSERIKQLPEIHYNESLLGNYKYFGARKLPELDKILVKEYDSQIYDENAKRDSLCNSTVQTNLDLGNGSSILNTQRSDSKEKQNYRLISNPTTKQSNRQDKQTIVSLRQALKTESAQRNIATAQQTQIDIHSAFLKTQFQGIAPSTAKNFNTIRNSKKFEAPFWPIRDISTGNQTVRNSNWMQMEPLLAFRSIQVTPQHNYIQSMPSHGQDLNMVMNQQFSRNQQNHQSKYSQHLNTNQDSLISKRNSNQNSIIAESPLGVLTPIPNSFNVGHQLKQATIELPILPQGNTRKSIELTNGKRNPSQRKDFLTKKETLGLAQGSPSGHTVLPSRPTSRQNLIITQDQSQRVEVEQINTEKSNEMSNDGDKMKQSLDVAKKQNRPKRKTIPPIARTQETSFRFQTKELNVVAGNSPFYRTFNNNNINIVQNGIQPLGFIHKNQIFTGGNTMLAHNTCYMKNQVRNRKKYGKLVQFQNQETMRKRPMLSVPQSAGLESTQEVIILNSNQTTVGCGIDLSPPSQIHDSDMVAGHETMDIGMSGPISPFHTISAKPEDPNSQSANSHARSLRAKGKNSAMSSSVDKQSKYNRAKPSLLGVSKHPKQIQGEQMMTGVYKIQSESKFNPEKSPEMHDVDSLVFQGTTQKQTVYNVIQNGQSKQNYDDFVQKKQ